MDYGVVMFPTEYAIAPDELARELEARGFESVWFPEHTHIPASRRSPWPGGGELPRDYWSSYDPFVALMAAAAVTRRLKLGTGICLVIERDPITTAKAVATLDRLSGGRVLFGIGGGWNAEEMENHGTPFKKRWRVLRERVLAMEAYGAKVILTPKEKTIEYSRELAEAMAAKEGYYILNQFANPDNYKAHYNTTGPEIWKDTGGRITHFVSAMGTTGTIMGVSRYLKEQNNNIQIVGTQPTDGSSIPGIRRWSPEFLPKIFERERVDRILDVSEADAKAMTRRLAKEEGILAGMSSGGALTAALKIADEMESGVIVFIICDRGDRYLSSDLFG